LSTWKQFIKDTKKKGFWNDFIQNIDDLYKTLTKLGYKETSEYYSQGEQSFRFEKGSYILTVLFSESD
jgi:hypothetical protein